ncbi:MAG: hypothetical protein LBD58_12970 [Treponema sp.]|nr:hypothetical protein [Treponema sp.]
MDEANDYGNPIEEPNSSAMTWIDSISHLYRKIHSSAWTPLGALVEIELEYDGAYHFPASYSYRSTHVSAEGQKILDRLDVEVHMHITDFTPEL